MCACSKIIPCTTSLERERECVCVCMRERVCVCMRERESVCVQKLCTYQPACFGVVNMYERESVCVCMCVCVFEDDVLQACVFRGCVYV